MTKRFITTTAIVGMTVASILGMSMEAEASSLKKMEVTKTNSLKILNIQDQKKVVTNLPKGSVVSIIKSMENQKGWYYVQTSNGLKGVCSGLYLKDTNKTSTNTTATKTYYANIDDLNLRTGAGVSYPIGKKINKGTAVNVVANLANGWSKLNVDGKTLYVNSSYLTQTKPSTATTTKTTTYYANIDDLNLRTGAGVSYPIGKKINKGTAVNVVANLANGWSKLNVDGKTLYVNSSYLSKTVPTRTYYANIDGLNLRTGIGTSYPVYKKINKGTAVNLVANLNGGWSKISMDGRNLYVNSSYLSPTKPSSTNYSYSVTATTSVANTRYESLLNIKRAFEKIDGKIVYPNQEFSYLNTIGKRTLANGFVASTTISGGNFVDIVGGGICQGSTTLHNAVMDAGLKVTERRNHSIASKYVGIGMDAMVSGTMDYKFKNTTKHPIRIRAYVANKKAVVRLESTGDIRNGYTFVQETTIYGNGLKAKTDSWKMKNGKKVEIQQTFYSSYRSV